MGSQGVGRSGRSGRGAPKGETKRIVFSFSLATLLSTPLLYDRDGRKELKPLDRDLLSG